MAANDDFPRGWTLYSAPGSGTNALTVPGIAGIAHVLDKWAVTLLGSTGTAPQLTLTSTAGTYTGLVLAWLSIQTVAAGDNVDRDSGDPALAMAPGEGFTLTLAAGADVSVIVIGGHDN